MVTESRCVNPGVELSEIDFNKTDDLYMILIRTKSFGEFCIKSDLLDIKIPDKVNKENFMSYYMDDWKWHRLIMDMIYEKTQRNEMSAS